jgi:CRP-like cAMP-binding protein
MTAETMELCQLRILKRSAFLAVLDAEPGLWKQVALVGAKRHYETLAEVKKSPLVRLLELLLSFCGTSQEPKIKPATYRVRMTNQQIADSVGVSERMARNYLHKLQDRRLITREGKSLFVIDPQGLRKLLEEIQ